MRMLLRAGLGHCSPRGAGVARLLACGLIASVSSGGCGGKASGCFPGEPCGDLALDEPACGDGEIMGPLMVSTQEELDALVGCERVVGNLRVMAFDGIDLRALSSLSEVAGALRLSGLESLEGLENLRHVDELSLSQVGAASLAPLASLESIGPEQYPPRAGSLGQLDVSRCDALRDFVGLGGESGLERFGSLKVSQNAALESLAGLPAQAELLSLVAQDNPRLRSFDAMPERIREDLMMSGTPLSDLSELAGLREARNVEISHNPQLTTLDGLSPSSFSRLQISDNPALVSLTRFDQITEFRSFQLAGNAALVDSPEFPSVVDLGRARGDVEVFDNPRLSTLTGFRSLESTRNLTVRNNAALA